MRFSPFLKRGVAILASVSAIGLTVPASSLQAAAPKCSNTSDSNVRFGTGNSIQSCDSAALADPNNADTVIVTLDDSGIHPKEVTVGQGFNDAHVYFVNLGTNVHSATQLPISPMWNSGAFVGIQKNDRTAKKKVGNQVFDTGGITPNPGMTAQQAITSGGYMIATPKNNGDYVYSSYSDCIAADRPIPSPTNFDCSPAVIHVVDDQVGSAEVKKALGAGTDWLGPAYRGSVLRPLGNPDCAMLAANSPILAPGRPNACVSARRLNFSKQPSGSKSKPLMGSVTVTIDDLTGFDPTALNIATDTTVTFTNKASNQLLHDVVFSNARMVPGMANGSDNVTAVNSGGLAPGQSWSVIFHWVANSTMGYASDAELDTLYNLNPQGNVGGDVAFNGGVVTVCAPGQFSPVSFDQLRGTGRPCTSIAAAQDPAVLVPGTVKDF